MTLGRPDEAERLLRNAVALCERIDAQAFLAMARRDLAKAAAPTAEGRVLVDQVRAAADTLGMPSLRR